VLAAATPVNRRTRRAAQRRGPQYHDPYSISALIFAGPIRRGHRADGDAYSGSERPVHVGGELDADPEVAAFEAITRSLLHSIATAADGGDLMRSPREAVESAGALPAW
jgi:hypothetical protein